MVDSRLLLAVDLSPGLSAAQRDWNDTMKFTAVLVVPVLSATTAIALAAIARADPYYEFQSPSGNIDCGLGLLNNNAFALCEIGGHTWVAPARPAACEGGWGDRVGLNQGSAATLDCHTDTVRGSDLPTLGYGDRLSAGAITCDSEFSGVTCTDASTGHYFSIARDSYELH